MLQQQGVLVKNATKLEQPLLKLNLHTTAAEIEQQDLYMSKFKFRNNILY